MREGVLGGEGYMITGGGMERPPETTPEGVDLLTPGGNVIEVRTASAKALGWEQDWHV